MSTAGAALAIRSSQLMTRRPSSKTKGQILVGQILFGQILIKDQNKITNTK